MLEAQDNEPKEQNSDVNAPTPSATPPVNENVVVATSNEVKRENISESLSSSTLTKSDSSSSSLSYTSLSSIKSDDNQVNDKETLDYLKPKVVTNELPVIRSENSLTTQSNTVSTEASSSDNIVTSLNNDQVKRDENSSKANSYRYNKV